MLENSAVNFAIAELNRSRLRKDKQSKDNFNLDIWKKIGELGWLDLLSSVENDTNFIARAIKLIAYQMGTKGAPELFMECGIGPLSLLHGINNVNFANSISSCDILVRHHISDGNDLVFQEKESIVNGGSYWVTNSKHQADFVLIGLLNSKESQILKIKLDDPSLTTSKLSLADGSTNLKTLSQSINWKTIK